MAREMELIKVYLPDGNHVWAGVFIGYPFAINNDAKLSELMRLLGMGIMVDTDRGKTIDEFIDYSKTHPILYQVPDWRAMIQMCLNQKETIKQ